MCHERPTLSLHIAAYCRWQPGGHSTGSLELWQQSEGACMWWQNGVAAMAWGACGYRLVLAEAGMSAQVLELTLAKSLTGSHRIVHHPLPRPNQARGPPPEVHLLQVLLRATSLTTLHFSLFSLVLFCFLT